MNSILLQKQLKENAMDLDNYCKSLKSWGQEMENKDKQLKEKGDTSAKPKNARNNNQPKKKEKIKTSGPIDYSKWNKFDADLECQRLDSDYEVEPELTDEEEDRESEAFVYKEKGNKHVKLQEWDKAIECYTKAIRTYNLEPIFYANRALCYLKQKNYEKAENDCTLSIQLDKTYVKAFQRRAAAKENLGQILEAIDDINQVLKYEPNNKESIAVLERLRKKSGCKPNTSNETRPVSIFTSSRNKNQQNTNVKQSTDQNTLLHDLDSDEIEMVKAIDKPPYLRSTKPLKRIEIKEIGDIPLETDIATRHSGSGDDNVAIKKHVIEKKSPADVQKSPLPVSNGSAPKEKGSCKETELSVKKNKESSKCTSTNNKNSHQVDTCKTNGNINTSQGSQQVVKNTKDRKVTFSPSAAASSNNNNNNNKNEKELNGNTISSPKTSIQFNNTWKNLKKPEEKFRYLKTIEPVDIPDIFQESLEVNVFSNIINILATYFIKNNENIYDYLYNLTKVKRFSAFVFFLDPTDKQNLWKIIEYLREKENKNAEEIGEILDKYELYP